MSTKEERIAAWLEENKTAVDYDDLENRYEETLREIYGDVNVCGMTMDAARLFRKHDETAFRCGVADWIGCSDDWVEVGGGFYSADDYAEAEEAIQEEDNLEAFQQAQDYADQKALEAEANEETDESEEGKGV